MCRQGKYQHPESAMRITVDGCILLDNIIFLEPHHVVYAKRYNIVENTKLFLPSVIFSSISHFYDNLDLFQTHIKRGNYISFPRYVDMLVEWAIICYIFSFVVLCLLV